MSGTTRNLIFSAGLWKMKKLRDFILDRPATHGTVLVIASAIIAHYVFDISFGTLAFIVLSVALVVAGLIYDAG